MTPESSAPNPSRTVERIREIIVGRQLDRLEQRLARLEHTGPASPSHAPGWDDERLLQAEARVEALQQSVQRLSESTRQELEARTQQQRAEIQRLSAQIQQVAATKAAEAENSAVRQLEGRLGAWLTQWQAGLQTHLNDREQKLATQLRNEVATLWESAEEQITRLQSRLADRQSLEQRLARISAAARALAEAAAPPLADSDFTQRP